MSQEQTICVTPHEAAVLLTLETQRLDYGTNSRLRREIAAAVTYEPYLPVVLDLSKLELLSSMVIGTLVDLRQGFKRTGRRFILIGLNKHNRTTLALTGVEKMFEIHESFDAALHALAQLGWRC